jgi:hypothetical protein
VALAAAQAIVSNAKVTHDAKKLASAAANALKMAVRKAAGDEDQTDGE